MNEILTNGAEIKNRIILEINKANQNIFVAMAWFTDRDIANAIINAKNRNLNIDIILSSNIQNETIKVMFEDALIMVHAFQTGDARGIMHHKFCLIDNRISINGSYNFSYNASTNNVENIQISDDRNIYTQLLSEFERLKYNIDHNIDMNISTDIPINQPVIQQVANPVNIIDTFAQQLHNLVYSSSQISAEEYKRKGYNTSKESKGNIDIFRTEYHNIKEEIKAFATEEGLNNRKNILTSNISNAYESTKINLENEKHDKIEQEKRNSELDIRQIKDKIRIIKDEKVIFESGNSNTGEKGLLQINNEIEKNKSQIKALEQTFIIKKFWSFGNIFILLLLLIFGFYLSVFFGSAFYKILFEDNVIKASLEAGVNPGTPQLVDANAITKIFRMQGFIFGIVATIFFLFPVLLSNVKLLGSKDKRINNLLFWVGLFIFDVVVAAMIAKNTDEIKSLLAGTVSDMQFWEVIKLGEFYMIFMFGTIPLIIAHYLIENIITAYDKSKKEKVDAEKHRTIQLLEDDMIDLVSEKEKLTSKVNEKNELISEHENNVLKLETDLNNLHNRTEGHFSELQRQIRAIYDDFNSKIISGKIFTDVILGSVISTYKSGFVEFLPEYYASNQVADRVRDIEQVISN